MLRVVQISDTHLYADPAQQYYDVNTDATLRQVLARISQTEEAADLILVTGDLVHDESAQGYQRFHQYLSVLEKPVYCLPGNHDDTALMPRILSAGNVSCAGCLQRDGWQFILLDSVVAGEVGGHLDRGELDRLDDCLQAHPGLHTLVCLHHPPLPSGCAWLDDGLILDNPGDLFDVLGRHGNVRGVVWGHVHQVFDTLQNNIRLLGSPSTMLQFKPGAATFAIDDTTPGYRWLDLYEDGRLESGIVRLISSPS